MLSCLYILEINSLPVASFAIIFSQSEGCLFTSFTVSFVVQKCLSLIEPHLFTFAFIFITLGVGHRGSCCDLYQRVFCLCFPLGVLVSGLMVRSLIHSEFIFVSALESVLVSFFYRWLSSFPSITC